jgi:hypothetical protein
VDASIPSLTAGGEIPELVRFLFVAVEEQTFRWRPETITRAARSHVPQRALSGHTRCFA